MKPETICAKLPQNLNSPPLKPCNLHMELLTPTPMLDHREAMRILTEQFQATRGWLCLQSNVVFFHATRPLTIPEGALLSGEAVNAAGESLHISEDGGGGLILVVFHEDQAKGASEPNSLMEQISLLGNQRVGAEQYPEILYRRYWRHEPGFGCHQYAARFMGFKYEEALA